MVLFQMFKTCQNKAAKNSFFASSPANHEPQHSRTGTDIDRIIAPYSHRHSAKLFRNCMECYSRVAVLPAPDQRWWRHRRRVTIFTPKFTSRFRSSPKNKIFCRCRHWSVRLAVWPFITIFFFSRARSGNHLPPPPRYF